MFQTRRSISTTKTFFCKFSKLFIGILDIWIFFLNQAFLQCDSFTHLEVFIYTMNCFSYLISSANTTYYGFSSSIATLYACYDLSKSSSDSATFFLFIFSICYCSFCRISTVVSFIWIIPIEGNTSRFIRSDFTFEFTTCKSIQDTCKQ